MTSGRLNLGQDEYYPATVCPYDLNTFKQAFVAPSDSPGPTNTCPQNNLPLLYQMPLILGLEKNILGFLPDI